MPGGAGWWAIPVVMLGLVELFAFSKKSIEDYPTLSLLADPFRHGLHAAFAFAMVACLVAAAASALRGGRPASSVLIPKEQQAA